LVADHPAHRRVAAQPVGVVHVFVTSQPPEHRLAQQPRQPVATILAGAGVRYRSSPVSVFLQFELIQIPCRTLPPAVQFERWTPS